LLTSVEAKWTQEALNVMTKQTDEDTAFDAMEASCAKVSKAVVQGSDGDRLRVIEYMKSVCSQKNGKANVVMCTAFANGLDAFMIGDDVYNREQLDHHEFCHKFWSTDVQTAAKAAGIAAEEETKRAAAEEVQLEAEEKVKRLAAAAEVYQKAQMDEKAAQKAAEAEGRRRAEKAADINNLFAMVAQKNHSVTVVENKTSNTAQSAEKLTNATTVTQENSSSLAVAENKTETKAVQNTTKAVQNTTKAVQNATKAVQNTTKVLQNVTTSNATTLVQNTTQVHENTSALLEKHVQIKTQGNLTNQARGMLRFVLNRTKQA